MKTQMPVGDADPARPTRRAILSSFAVVPPALAFSGIVAARSTSAGAASPRAACDWVDRWFQLGCGARINAHGNLALTIRAAAQADASLLTGELQRPGMVAAIHEALLRTRTECGAIRAVERMHRLDAEYDDNPDDDEAFEEAWTLRWDAAALDLVRTPANTPKGLAAKLREGMDLNGSDIGEAIVGSALAQLEGWD